MIALKQNADASAGLQGTDLDDGGFVVLSLPYSAITNTSGTFLTCSGHVLTRRMIVKAITGCPDTVSSNAVTISMFKAPSATALGSGVALHTGSFNPNTGAATNQALTLSTASGALDVAAGSRIGFVISATMGAAGQGVITVTMAPA